MKLPVIIPYFSFDGKDTHKAFLLRMLAEADKYGVEFIVAEGVHPTLSNPLPDLSSRCAQHLVFPAVSCLWLKENLINLAVRSSSLTNAAFAFVDSDVVFCDSDWAKKGLDALSSVDVLQPFSHRHDVDEHYVIQRQLDSRVEPTSFAYLLHKTHSDRQGLVQGQPGFAWIMRRSMFDQIGGLFDELIVGGGDSCLATLIVSSLVPDFKAVFHRRFHRRYAHLFLPAVEERVPLFSGLKCGFLTGSVIHLYHGRLLNRTYNQRFNILLKCNFRPTADLARSNDGVLQYACANTVLEQQVAAYLAGRSI